MVKKRISLVAFVAILSFLLYNLSNRVGMILGGTNVQFTFERGIPFIPEMIIAYASYFPYIVITVFIIKDYEDFKSATMAYLSLYIVSAFIFMVFPTTMARPLPPTDNIFGLAVAAYQKIDQPCNLFPSLHVSGAALATLINCRLRPNTKYISIFMAILISASTLLVKQHALIDIFGGLGIAITVNWFFSKRSKK